MSNQRPKAITPRLLHWLRPEAPWLALAALCMLALAFTTALAAALVGPALQALLAGGKAGDLASRFLPAGWLHQRFGLPALIVALAIVKGLAYFGQFHLMTSAGQRTASRLRQRLLEAVLAAPPEVLGRQQTGDLLARFTHDATAVEMAVAYALGAYVRDPVTALLLFGVCLRLDWRLSLMAFAALPLTLWPLARLLKRLRRRLKAASQSQGTLGHLVAEGLSGLPSIQVDGLFEREAERFARANQEALGHQLASANVRALSSPLMELAAAAGLCAVLVIGANSVASGSLSGAQLTSFLAAALLLAQPLKALSKVGHFAVAGLVSLARIEDLLGQAAPPSSETGPLCDAGELTQGLTLRAVGFRYAADAPPALHDLSFEVRRGEKLAVVGQSGAGKSTLFALLLGLRQPGQGELLFDGTPLAALRPESLRRQVAWLGQDPLLFDGTIADNIALGEDAPDPERLRAAAARAQALGFIERAGGFGASVGERGRRFSGGERQRLCIARALYYDAPILLLDEPTSHLDPDNEQALQVALGELLLGRTAVIIAHRLATVHSCDRAVVLEGGRLVEEGTPEALLQRGGPFASLFGERSLTALPRPN